MTFKLGDRVSTGYSSSQTPIIGTVIRVGALLKIRIESGARKGELTYPDAPPWILGVGSHESMCRECGRRYRREAGEDEFFCASCRADRPLDVQPIAADAARPLPPEPSVGLHVAGEPSQCNGVITQWCTRCGEILKQVSADFYERFRADGYNPLTYGDPYRVGSVVEVGRGPGGIHWRALRPGIAPTCAVKARRAS